MFVKDIMSDDVKAGYSGDNMQSVAMQMWEYDRGFIPVIDDENHITGVITDRDICMSSAMNHKPLWELRTEDITKDRPLHCCNINDDVTTALNIMRASQLHRLPVIDDDNMLVGVIGMADIINHTAKGGKSQISMQETLDVMKGIYAPR